MLTPEDFRTLIVDPAVSQFRNDPASLLHAYTVIWAIDAYVSHVAHKRKPTPNPEDRKKRKKIEDDFKRELCDISQAGGWQFRVVNEASNAGKHALRTTTHIDVQASSAVARQNIDGWLWFLLGGPALRWGEQVVIELDVEHDEQNKVYLDSKNRPFTGPVFPWVPVEILISPSLERIDTMP